MSNSEKEQSIDSTSFRSILNGVKRMREQYNVGESNNQTEVNRQTHQIPQQTAHIVTHTPTEDKTTEGRPGNIGTIERSSAAEFVRERSQTPKQNESRTDSTNNNDGNNRIRKRGNDVQTYSSVQVSQSQKGNPLLSNSLMKSIPWSYNGSILSDYYVNPTLQILFLSLKYHKLHPEYIWQRLKKLNKGSTIVTTTNDRVLRLLLVVVDIDSHQEILRKLLNFCVKHDLSLILAWSFEEAGNYIAFCKQYELSSSKVKSAIRGTKSSEYQACVVDTLTSIRAVNKTDSVKLLANCGSVQNIVLQSCQDDEEIGLSNIQGLGSRKLQSMKSVFLEPFIYNKEYD